MKGENMTYIAPKFFTKSFTCPHCGTLCMQTWSSTTIDYSIQRETYHFLEDISSNDNILGLCTCSNCRQYSLWLDNKMIVPWDSNAPLPIESMPQNVKDVYNEARNIYSISPRASAALLRLALQILCKELGGKGEKINEDIALLNEKGLPPKVYRGLDYVRVIGNNAVHPGEINLNDNPQITLFLFHIINIIVETMIDHELVMEELFASLSPTIHNGILKREHKVSKKVGL